MAQHFAQLSDPHLTSLAGVRPRALRLKQLGGYLSWLRRRRHQHRPEVLQALQLDLQQSPPQQLLVTGDLTHIGLPQEFAEAAAWLRRLGDPARVALVPGNHDACVAAPWGDTFALWQPYMAADGDAAGADLSQYPTLRVRGELAFIGLSSAVPTPYGRASGPLGEEQRRKLAPLLDACRARGLFRVVYLHHCPAPGYERKRKALTDAAPLWALLEKHGAELVLHGHGHHNVEHTLHSAEGPVPVIGVASASAIGGGRHEPAAYNRYAVTRQDSSWALQVCTRVYSPHSGTFAQGDRSSIELQREHRT